MDPVRIRPSVRPPHSPSPAACGDPRAGGLDEIERLLTESPLIGVIEFARDPWVLDCNDTIARMLGYDSRRALRGRHASELFFEGAEFIRSFAGLRPGDTLQRDVRMQARDGSVIHVAAHAVCRPDELHSSGAVLATFLPLPRSAATDPGAPGRLRAPHGRREPV